MKKLVRHLSFAWLLVAAQFATAQTQIIVQMQAGREPHELVALFPVILRDVTPSAPFALFDVKAGFDPHEVEAAMRLRPDLVVFAEDDVKTEAPENIGAGKGGTIGAVFDPGSVYGENSRMFEQINYRATVSGFRGRAVRVGILDTGAPVLNMHIRTRVVKGVAIAEDRADWFDLASGANTNGNDTPDDALGHGSMVTGLVLQLAPQAQYLIARVADSDGVSSAWNIIKGMAFSAANGAEVINVSLGAVDDIAALSDVVEGWLDQQGILVVAAAGNNALPEANSPASIHHVVCVTGVDPDDVKADFSNWDQHARQAAPATGIKSSWWDNTIGVWSGTSFAAPMVAAVVADALQWRPARLNYTQLDVLRDVLESVGDNIDAKNPGYERELGLRLNAANLRQAIVKM